MKLSDIVKQLTEEKDDGSRFFIQKTLGLKLGFEPNNAQQNVSTMKRGDEDSVWEIHWNAFLKLIPICLEYGILSARDLEKDGWDFLRRELRETQERIADHAEKVAGRMSDQAHKKSFKAHERAAKNGVHKRPPGASSPGKAKGR